LERPPLFLKLEGKPVAANCLSAAREEPFGNLKLERRKQELVCDGGKYTHAEVSVKVFFLPQR